MLRFVGFLGWAVLAAASEMRSDDFPNYDQGTIPAWKDLASLRGAHPDAQVGGKISCGPLSCKARKANDD